MLPLKRPDIRSIRLCRYTARAGRRPRFLSAESPYLLIDGRERNVSRVGAGVAGAKRSVPRGHGLRSPGHAALCSRHPDMTSLKKRSTRTAEQPPARKVDPVSHRVRFAARSVILIVCPQVFSRCLKNTGEQAISTTHPHGCPDRQSRHHAPHLPRRDHKIRPPARPPAQTIPQAIHNAGRSHAKPGRSHRLRARFSAARRWRRLSR